MNASKDRLIQLFNLYFNHTASQQEIDEFYELIRKSAGDEFLTTLLKELWEDAATQKPLFTPEKTEEILKSILEHDEDKPTVFQKISPNFSYLLKAAAAIILMLSGLLYLNQKKPVLVVKTVKQTLKQDILPGGSHAVLTLANGKTIKLDTSPNGVLAKRDGLKITKTANGQLICNLVAADVKPDDTENIISTPKGGQYQVSLSDGTKVWLNAATSLRFPVSFNSGYRKVELTGEAYFEVSKNPGKPFLVKTRNTTIKVFGTHFNVNAYPDETVSKTTLLEGSISIKSTRDSDLLKPGEQAIQHTDGKIALLKNVNEKSITAWKNGQFSFEDSGIEEIMRQVARWYDVSIVYEGKIPVKKLTGNISRNVNASALLSMLNYTGIDFRIEGKKIIVLN